jgi:predicted enzyme related to lactoylglutathione lyase
MQNGHFVWHDLYSINPESCKEFYTALLGWSIQEQDMGTGPYDVIYANEVAIGGIGPLQPGMPASNWVSYIAVNDMATALEHVSAAGGSVDVPAFAVPGVGQMAYVRDPWGAVFAPFKDDNPDNVYAMPAPNPPGGSAVWHELVTPDESGAISFYSKLTGWAHVAWDMGDFTYNGMTIGDVPMAGIFQAEPDGPTAWTIYFESNGPLADSIDAITRLGGSLVGDRVEVPGTGAFQLAKDPSGAAFGLLESERK